MQKTVLITGFGPFPRAPFNPTGPLVQRLARVRRPAFADVKRVAHVFATSYSAVERELPDLIARHRPAAILMFGLATRTRHVRIEMRARNAITAAIPDVDGIRHRSRTIVAKGPAARMFPPLSARLMLAARRQRVPTRLSRDAGRYLCNYLCWRALELAERRAGPPILAFVHVPAVRRAPVARARSKRRSLTVDDLLRAAEAILCIVLAAARARR